ncbi:MAG: flippase activity-associated protein Agl23 [Planctomycetota bacterium]
MRPLQTCWVIVLLAAILAVGLRLPKPALRPMHTDEAVYATKFGQLLEENQYRYDRREYHGPTLNYFTLIPAWLSGTGQLSEVTESTLRIVPVFFGVLLILLLLLIADGLGFAAVVWAAVLAAISPAMVFYSRYYIPEMLLVFFTFAAIVAGFRYIQNPKIGWALLAGAFLGLMHATKETCIIAFGSMALSLLLVLFTCRTANKSVKDSLRRIKPPHIVAGILAAVALSMLFYSSFFTNPRGVIDSVLTYKNYFHQAGECEFHIHPWYYYLKMFIYSKYDTGPAWTEAIIVLLAIIGFIVAVRKKNIIGANVNFLKFLAFYTIIMTLIYSAIPYKTPWSSLSFFHGMILLAGVGAAALIKLMPKVSAKAVAVSFIAIASIDLLLQAYIGNYISYANPANPYVYAHTTTDVFEITARVEQVAEVSPQGRSMAIDVVCEAGDYWPLPWYLRSFPNMGWYERPNEITRAADVVIASGKTEPALLRRLYELPEPGKKNLYVPLFDNVIELRPSVELRGYITKDLWDEFQKLQADSK